MGLRLEGYHKGAYTIINTVLVWASVFIFYILTEYNIHQNPILLFKGPYMKGF